MALRLDPPEVVSTSTRAPARRRLAPVLLLVVVAAAMTLGTAGAVLGVDPTPTPAASLVPGVNCVEYPLLGSDLPLCPTTGSTPAPTFDMCDPFGNLGSPCPSGSPTPAPSVAPVPGSVVVTKSCTMPAVNVDCWDPVLASNPDPFYVGTFSGTNHNPVVTFDWAVTNAGDYGAAGGSIVASWDTGQKTAFTFNDRMCWNGGSNSPCAGLGTTAQLLLPDSVTPHTLYIYGIAHGSGLDWNGASTLTVTFRAVTDQATGLSVPNQYMVPGPPGCVQYPLVGSDAPVCPSQLPTDCVMYPLIGSDAPTCPPDVVSTVPAGAPISGCATGKPLVAYNLPVACSFPGLTLDVGQYFNWLGCVLAGMVKAGANAVLFLANVVIDLLFPCPGMMGKYLDAFMTEVTGAGPFAYVKDAVLTVQSGLAGGGPGVPFQSFAVMGTTVELPLMEIAQAAAPIRPFLVPVVVLLLAFRFLNMIAAALGFSGAWRSNQPQDD